MQPPSRDAMEGINIILRCARQQEPLPHPESDEGKKVFRGARYIYKMMVFYETLSSKYLPSPVAILEEIGRRVDTPKATYEQIIQVIATLDGAESRASQEMPDPTGGGLRWGKDDARIKPS